jgi:hypothetical protein
VTAPVVLTVYVVVATQFGTSSSWYTIVWTGINTEPLAPRRLSLSSRPVASNVRSISTPFGSVCAITRPRSSTSCSDWCASAFSSSTGTVSPKPNAFTRRSRPPGINNEEESAPRGV